VGNKTGLLEKGDEILEKIREVITLKKINQSSKVSGENVSNGLLDQRLRQVLFHLRIPTGLFNIPFIHGTA
jgi:hypothetical protein